MISCFCRSLFIQSIIDLVSSQKCNPFQTHYSIGSMIYRLHEALIYFRNFPRLWCDQNVVHNTPSRTRKVLLIVNEDSPGLQGDLLHVKIFSHEVPVRNILRQYKPRSLASLSHRIHSAIVFLSNAFRVVSLQLFTRVTRRDLIISTEWIGYKYSSSSAQ